MLVVGITLQLVAGIVLALPHIIDESKLIGANERLKSILELPSSEKRYRRGIPLFGAILVALAYSIWVFLFSASADWEWYEAAFGILLGSALMSATYMFLLIRLSNTLKDKGCLVKLTKGNDDRALLLGNAFLVLFAILVLVLAFLCSGWQSSLSEGTPTWFLAIALSVIVALLFVMAFLTAPPAVLFLLLSAMVQLFALMAKSGKPLWIMVLSLYLLGGFLLIANAVMSS